MTTWPRRVQGHVIDREVTFRTGEVEYRYHCVRCGLRVENPDDPRQDLRPCGTVTPGVGQGR